MQFNRGGASDAEGAERARGSILAAHHEFSNAFGDLARGKRNWQLVAFATTATSLALALTAYRLASAAHVVPYVVQVDRGGQVVSVAPADKAAAPDARLVALQLAQFLRAVRTVLPAQAAAAQAEAIRRAYAFAAPGAAAFLNTHFSDPKNDPRVLGTRLTREVDVTGVVRLPDSDVWRLRWIETERPTQGAGATRRSAWEGYVSVALVPPTSEATLQENPLGVYVTSISWTQLTDDAGSGASPDSTHDGGTVP